MTPKHPVNI